jgi:hypothetical protein
MHLQAAFEHCVRAYVIRCECVPLGPGHPDTAVAGHNLGVVLDCLGKSSRGLQLVEQAQQVGRGQRQDHSEGRDRITGGAAGACS